MKIDNYEIAIEIQKSREYLDRYARQHYMSYDKLLGELRYHVNTHSKTNLMDFSIEVWLHLYNVTGDMKLERLLKKYCKTIKTNQPSTGESRISLKFRP